ncbi:MAG TPA: rubrerythrin family protein [Ignavibacteriales bacterium]|nr:rubrerythrin family protein [Ignavibacteriales bacterium]
MSKTQENLKEAFSGESQAYQKYMAFAKKAEKDGLPNIARLFRTAAEAEKIHAEGHLRSLDGVGSTVENLKAAISGETYEYTVMYPPMAEEAEKEGHKAKRMFNYALKAEEIHAELYKMALDCAILGKDLDDCPIYLCPVCGHIEIGQMPENCPICGAKGDKYVKL